MLPLKARVRNGRLVLDAPTSLPDGMELELVVVGVDDMNDVEREALHAELQVAEAEIDAGKTISADEVLERLGTRRAAS
jgi:hypothetical protein